jgi:3-deoxy-D-manno-octulosonic-acid transferase
MRHGPADGFESKPVGLTVLERAYGLLSPLAFGAAQITERLRGASARELRSRSGYVPQTKPPSLWFHGASAGEMAAALRLVSTLHEHRYRFTALYTSTNRAGVEFVSHSDPDAEMATLSPWDTPACVSRALDCWQPYALFLIETELWPRLVFEAYQRNIPVLSVSARIYPRDMSRYSAIKPFMAPTFRRLTRILTQDETERERFIRIGAPEDICLSAGNLKYLQPAMPSLEAASLAEEIGLKQDDRVVVVGSVHQSEASAVLATLRRLNIRNLRMILAPRHLSSGDVVWREAGRLGWKIRRRSDGVAGPDWQVLVLDTFGELGRFYSIGSCAVVGGGFGKFGGHNPFEPVMAGAPVVCGLHFDNFGAEVRALTAVVPDTQVANIEQLGAVLTKWLSDDALRLTVLSRQRSAIPDGSAIAKRYLEALGPWLSVVHV